MIVKCDIGRRLPTIHLLNADYITNVRGVNIYMYEERT